MKPRENEHERLKPKLKLIEKLLYFFLNFLGNPIGQAFNLQKKLKQRGGKVPSRVTL